MITSAIEHPAVLSACAQLEREGVAVTCVPVGADGVVDPDDIRRALRPGHRADLGHARQQRTGHGAADRRDRADRARGRGAVSRRWRAGAGQDCRWMSTALGVDLYSISGHKIYAPKGSGRAVTCARA